MSLVVEQIDPPDVEAWQISPYAAGDVVAALGRAASLGYTGTTTTFVQPNSSDVLWTLKLSKPGVKDAVAYAGDWLVCDGQHVLVFTNQDFIARYTADVDLVWDSAAPVVEALPSDQVTVTFAQPVSPNGPFTYTAVASGESLNVVEQSVSGGRVTLQGDGLITGDEYTFTVTVTPRFGEPATSQPSNTITAEL